MKLIKKILGAIDRFERGTRESKRRSAVHDYYTMRTWGHDYSFSPAEGTGGRRGRISGWGPLVGERIVRGDYLCLVGPTKKVSVYKVTHIEYMRDPSDMWFADATYVESQTETDRVLRRLEDQVNAKQRRTA